MLNLGFKAQLANIFTMMREKRQNILFSATMTEAVDEVLEEYFANPVEISLAKSGTPLEKIEQLAYKVENFNTKINLLEHLICRVEERFSMVVNMFSQTERSQWICSHKHEYAFNVLAVLSSQLETAALLSKK